MALHLIQRLTESLQLSAEVSKYYTHWGETEARDDLVH